ncbi:MAG: sensor histidine kinase, partial [Desulfovibrionaceae bacterium]
MRLRLFGKILISFWLTFIFIMEGVWVIFTFYDTPERKPWKVAMARSVADIQLGSAASALRLGGEQGLAMLLESWPGKVRPLLTWEPVAPTTAPTTGQAATPAVPEPQDAEFPFYTRTVFLDDGRAYALRYDTSDLFKPRKAGPLNIPAELLVLGILGGLLFSAALAWYLTAPVWRLREGFGQLAQGRLGVRLKPLMGRRRDEIVDLADDFDVMAGRMQALVESREQLLHDVSHELRSPLARMHMAIGLARQNPSRTEALLGRIEQESSRMDELVGELLTLSRVEAQGATLDDYFDLMELLRVVVNNARFEARQDGVDIALRLPGGTGEDETDEAGASATVRGDAELVRRALENVLRNAVRHSPRGTVVEVGVDVGVDVGVEVGSKGAAHARTIRIEDRGPGVPPDALQRIFDPFVRLGEASGTMAAKEPAKEPAKGAGQGAGLGLAIARRAIAVH